MGKRVILGSVHSACFTARPVAVHFPKIGQTPWEREIFTTPLYCPINHALLRQPLVTSPGFHIRSRLCLLLKTAGDVAVLWAGFCGQRSLY